MWGWLGETLKWLNSGGSKRVDFEAVTTRWETMFDKANRRQEEVLARLQSVEGQRDKCLEDLQALRDMVSEQKRKFGKLEDKMEKALTRIMELENKV